MGTLRSTAIEKNKFRHSPILICTCNCCTNYFITWRPHLHCTFDKPVLVAWSFQVLPLRTPLMEFHRQPLHCHHWNFLLKGIACLHYPDKGYCLHVLNLSPRPILAPHFHWRVHMHYYHTVPDAHRKYFCSRLYCSAYSKTCHQL